MAASHPRLMGQTTAPPVIQIKRTEMGYNSLKDNILTSLLICGFTETVIQAFLITGSNQFSSGFGAFVWLHRGAEAHSVLALLFQYKCKLTTIAGLFKSFFAQKDWVNIYEAVCFRNMRTVGNWNYESTPSWLTVLLYHSIGG